MPAETVTPIQENSKEIKTKEKTAELVFNYQAFLGLLKQPDARNVVTSIRKFIESYKINFSENMTIIEQVRKYREYRDGLAQSLFDHPVWIEAGEEAQMLGAEGIEYMTMNQIHSKAFCPPHSDDAERDEAISKKLFFFSWLQPNHLDIQDGATTIDDKRLEKAGLEFKRINEYTTPRDKLICLMNGVRILVKSFKKEEKVNADLLMPVLILALVRSRPDKLYSNLQYISRFRNTSFLPSETAYNLTTLSAAVAFVEKLDKTALVVTDEEYEENMEGAIARYNEESLQKQEEAQKKHQEEMAAREAEMIRADQAAHEVRRKESPMRRSGSAEFKSLLGDLEQNGSKLVSRVRQSSFMQQSKEILSEFVTEAKTVVKSLVDDSDEEAEEEIRRRLSKQEEEEFQLQLALAISLSEAEANLDTGKEKVSTSDSNINGKVQDSKSIEPTVMGNCKESLLN